MLAISLEAQNLPSIVPVEYSSVPAPSPTSGHPMAAPNNYGYILMNSVKHWKADAPITDLGTLQSTSRTLREVKLASSYYDGVGRPFQQVQRKASPSGYDVVTPIVYDNYGKQVQQFLPFVANTQNGDLKLDPFTAQQSFYSNTPPSASMQVEQVFYQYTQYENSPLNRVTKTLAEGNSWAGSNRGVKKDYQTAGADEVRILKIVSTNLSIPVSSNFYTANKIFREVLTDENAKRTVTYTDLEGRTILKKVEIALNSSAAINQETGWLCTYYVYDDLNNFRFVIPPKAVEKLTANGWYWGGYSVASSVIANELCFAYTYDSRNRISIKKVPGAEEVYMVYDSRDRLIMMQDGNLRTSGKWMLTRYDAQNRATETGVWNNNGNSFATHQFYAGITDPLQGYPSLSYGYEQLQQTYYDNYDFFTGIPSAVSGGFQSYMINGNNFITSYNQYPDYAQPVQSNVITRNKITGTKTRIMGAGNTYVYSVNYYDDKGQVSQTQSTNPQGGYEITTFQYDFSGKLLRSHQVHQFAPGYASVEELTLNDYDDAGRLTKTRKRTTQGGVSTEKTIASLEYNSLGQLKAKLLGTKPDDASQPLSRLDYDYNIRGWISGINRNYAKPESQQGSTDRHFGMELSYDYGFNTGSQYNGNISGIKWRSMGDGDYRSYGFTYDPSNRLLRADFNQRAGYNDWKKAVSSNLNINFSMYMGDGVNPSTAYDANGNILSISQYGLQQNASPMIDQLNYSYQQSNSSNKLDLVSDGSGFTPKLGDFKDGGNWGSDYSYDANGNMKTDANKSISNITYNYLNLPEQISISGKGNIAYTYDAQGGKRSKIVTESGATIVYKGQNFYNVSIITTTYYINSWVYESKSYSDGTLQNAMGYATKAMFSGHEDGRIRPLYTNNTITSFAGDYFVKDHLGNIRMVLTDEQQVNYYPATTLEGTYSYGAPEANSMVNQEKQYYRIDPGYIVDKPWYNSYLDYQNHNNVPPSNPNPNYPAGVSPGQFATSQKVYSLNGSTNRTGLEMVIKVMAGDKVDIFGRSYHTNYSSVSNSNSTPLSILQIMSGLISSPSNAISGKGVSASQLESWNSGLVPSSFIRGQNYESGTTVPKAYINYIFLDDQFRYVDGGASRVGNYGEVKQHWSELSNIAAQKNGYLLVYVSNESNFTVYFDNLQVVHKPGPIVEETHYYPFGLVMNGISSKGLNGSAENKLKFNSKEEQRKEFYDGSGLDWSDFGARMYDNQIMRWMVIDPMSEKYYSQTPYNYALNNPVLFNDPDGRDVDPSKLKGTGNITALKNILSTNAGYKFIAQFMHKGQSIKINIGSKTTTFTFNVEGARAKDNLVLASSPNEVMSPKNDGVIRLGLTREYERDNYDKKIGVNKDYDIKKGVTYLVNLDEDRGVQESTSTLTHELTVHVDPNVQRGQKIENKVVDGTLKPGTEAYLKQLETIKNSASTDHKNLGQGKNTNYQNITAQLDKLKNTNQYTELYKQDVKEHK